MIVVVVLAAAALLFRGLGAAGVEALASWADSARWGLAAMFVFTGVAHFGPMRRDMARMVPGIFPNPGLLVALTGMLEIAGAVGLLLPATRRLAAACLIAFLVAVFPANVRAAREGIELGGRAPTPLWLRAPMQALFIGLLWWSTLA